MKSRGVGSLDDRSGSRRRRGVAASLALATLFVAAHDQVGTAALGDGEYTSPTYGYSISWDPAVWTDADDYVGSYDSLSLEHAGTTFMLTGTNVYDDLSSCVSENVASFEALGPFAPATGIVGPTPGPGAESAVVSGDVPTDAGTTVTMVVYVECRWAEENTSTVAATLFGPAETFAQVVAPYEALIARLVVPGGAAPAVTTTPGAAPPTTAAATTASDPAASAPDVAAMSVVPADLEEVGLPGHGWSNGMVTSDPQSVADFLSFWRSDTDVAIVDGGMAAAAPTRVHVVQLGRPTTEGDPSTFEERVVSYVMAFDDEASAAAGFAAWAAAWQGEYSSEPVDAAIGDERFVVAGEASEAAEHGGGPFPFVHVGFRSGAVVAGVSVEFFTGYAPEQKVAVALAALQAERVDAVIAGGAPDLSGRILYFDVPGVQWGTAMYGIRDGQRLFRDSDTRTSAAESQATATNAGIIDQFQIDQQLGGDLDGRTPPLAYYTARIVSFPDAARASAYVADSVDRLTEGGAENLMPVNASATAGEEVAAYTYTHQRDDGVAFNDYRMYARTGSIVFSFSINSTGEIDVAGLDKIGALQAACLAGETSCRSGFPVPPSLLS